MDLIRHFLKELEDEISSERFTKHYETLRKKYLLFKPFLTPQDFITFLHDQKNFNYILKDNILSILIAEYQAKNAPDLLGAYLIIIFKHGLLKTFSHFKQAAKQFASVGEIDLWFHIVTIFLGELREFDLEKHKIKIASKILSRILHRLRDYFKALTKEIILSKELFYRPIEIVPEEIESLLGHLVKSRVLSEIDRDILLATKLYGKSMKDISLKLKGLSYTAIRHRKARAQKILYKYLKKNKDSLAQFGP